MKNLLKFIITVLFFLTTNLQAQTDCRLLKPGKIVTTNAIYNSQNNQQYVMSIVDTEAENTADSIEVYCHPNWTSAQIGTITKSVYDSKGNIYVAASSLYNADSEVSNYRYGDIGGGENDLKAAGAIYRLDAYTGEADVFTTLPQQRAAVDIVIFITFSATRQTGPGIADITYNYKHQQLIAANNEDGKIYQINKWGNVIDSFDPGLADDGAIGFAPINERITAIETTQNRIYYAVWHKKTSYIASVKIRKDGTIDKHSARIEIVLSKVDKIDFPKYPITNISFISDDIISVTQSELLNEATKSSKNIPSLMFKHNYWQWNYIGSLKGSTDQTEIISKSSISTPNVTFSNDYTQRDCWGFSNYSYYENSTHPSSICYIGLDALDNNYVITTNLDELSLNKSQPIANFQQNRIPGLYGKVKSIQVVDEDKLSTYSNCNKKLKALNEPVGFRIYPNPCQSYFYIRNHSEKEIEYVKIYDTTGKLIKEMEAPFYNKNMVDEMPGVYIVSIKTKTKLNTVKLFVAE